MGQVFYLVNSDNFENTYMTEEAYKEIRLQMSSGDFGAHSAKKVSKVPKSATVVNLKDVTDHPIKIEELEISLIEANEYVNVMRDFLQDDLDFNKDRIEAVGCRRRDGFFPHNYNKGGLEGISYRDEYSCCENTGFKGTDAALSRAWQYEFDCFLSDNPTYPKGYSDLTDEQREELHEYQSNSDDTVQFQARIMMTSETTANVDFYVSASDSPYHRKSDDKLEIEIKFKTPAGMKRKLKALLKNEFVAKLIQNNREAY